jgi:hypothetical protein
MVSLDEKRDLDDGEMWLRCERSKVLKADAGFEKPRDD